MMPGRNDDYSPGEVARSQAVSTFGVGSIYELRTFSRNSAGTLHSVMIAGLDYWKPDPACEIHEPSLERALGVKHFFLPPAGEDRWKMGDPAVPAVRFPRWLVCNQCNRLGVVGMQFEDRAGQGPRCADQKCRGKGIPSRLVVACFHEGDPDNDTQPGHIDDFPWISWAHSTSADGRCQKPQLKLESEGNSTGLSGLVVSCHSDSCKGKVGRSLEGVFGDHALAHLSCLGRRPWLDDSEPCGRKVRALLRGASNLYFPANASALSIPPYSRRIYQLLLDSRCQSILASVGKIGLEIIVDMLRNAVAEFADYSDEQLVHTIQELTGQTPDAGSGLTESQQRGLERAAIIRGYRGEQGDEFEAYPITGEDLGGTLEPHLNRLVIVPRLREVRALRGFHRVNPMAGGDSYHLRCAPISGRPMDWLPAIEVRGEGIYLELRSDMVEEWENSDAVQQRAGIIQRNMENTTLKKYGYERLSGGYLLVHTLSHLLIKQLCLECGYSSASLRERLFVERSPEENWTGVLIYTATAGADGTLGGLTAQGEPDRFEQILLGALESARWCSSDPLCIESQGQGADALNLAACHACSLVAETSCEARNMFLDRALIVGTLEDPDLGFFSSLISRNDDAVAPWQATSTGNQVLIDLPVYRLETLANGVQEDNEIEEYITAPGSTSRAFAVHLDVGTLQAQRSQQGGIFLETGLLVLLHPTAPDEFTRDAPLLLMKRHGVFDATSKPWTVGFAVPRVDSIRIKYVSTESGHRPETVSADDVLVVGRLERVFHDGQWFDI
ncbi:MAG: DUF1998 domain-containing protein [Pseudomonadota bacterium]|nr:DUF1998 domain-containing protein [Pseudomonadota bacterium]